MVHCRHCLDVLHDCLTQILAHPYPAVDWKGHMLLFTQLDGFQAGSDVQIRRQQWWVRTYMYCAHPGPGPIKGGWRGQPQKPCSCVAEVAEKVDLDTLDDLEGAGLEEEALEAVEAVGLEEEVVERQAGLDTLEEPLVAEAMSTIKRVWQAHTLDSGDHHGSLGADFRSDLSLPREHLSEY